MKKVDSCVQILKCNYTCSEKLVINLNLSREMPLSGGIAKMDQRYILMKRSIGGNKEKFVPSEKVSEKLSNFSIKKVSCFLPTRRIFRSEVYLPSNNNRNSEQTQEFFHCLFSTPRSTADGYEELTKRQPFKVVFVIENISERNHYFSVTQIPETTKQKCSPNQTLRFLIKHLPLLSVQTVHGTTRSHSLSPYSTRSIINDDDNDNYKYFKDKHWQRDTLGIVE